MTTTDPLGRGRVTPFAARARDALADWNMEVRNDSDEGLLRAAEVMVALLREVTGAAPDTGEHAPVHVILTTAADMIEARHYHNFCGGPQIWDAVYTAADDRFTSPAVEALRRHLRAAQVQFWDGTQEEAVAGLRAAAGEATLDLAAYQDAGTTRRVEAIRTELCRMLNLHTGPHNGMEHLADLVIRRARRDAEEIAWLTREVSRLDALREAG